MKQAKKKGAKQLEEKNEKEKLVMFGGKPVITKPYPTNACVDQKEIDSVLEVFKKNEFSRYAGGPGADVQDLLVMKSKDAENYERNYWCFLGGRKVRKFESGWAQKFGIDYAIAVNSATSGLSLALAATNIGPGDEVITTPLTFTATGTSILVFNSIPVFVDVDPKTFCLDANKIEAAITPSTKAILVVHLLGNAADMDKIMEIAKKHKLVVVEDCAQTPGVKYKGKYVGTIGDLGVYSFQETKNMMTGEGGMIVTNNPEYARKARLIRNHGESVMTMEDSDDFITNIIGFNLRMTELTAAVGVEQLKKLDELNRVRNENAFYLFKRLEKYKDKGLAPPYIDPNIDYVCHVMCFMYDEKKTGVPRELFVKALCDEGMEVGTGYIRLLYNNPVFRRQLAYGKKGCPWNCKHYKGKATYKPGICPVAEELIGKRFIWLFHNYKPNTKADMELIAKGFEKVFDNIDALRKVDMSKIKLEYKR